ncbi:VOC family protein [Pseudarthrobacter sp. H2]|uniref:VOC family protein n=1 Tax=Pseudarthrobacter sp. H2 TaxID=3418415 RepID=UPI003CF611E7
MLNRFYVNPILPAQDGNRARIFYRDVLGLDLLSGPTEDPMAFGAASGSSIVLSEMPDRIPPPYPVVSFMVTGIEDLVEALKVRGVNFQALAGSSFAGVEGKPVGDVMDFGPVKSAFLKDTEGNVIALNEIMT